MRRSPDLRPRLWDGAVVLAVLLLALLVGFKTWGGGDEGLVAVISVDGEEVQRLSLTEDYAGTIENGGVTLDLRIENGEAWVESSDCPTQDCVHTGHISRGGQSIVCLPGRVSVQLTGGDGVDAVIG